MLYVVHRACDQLMQETIIRTVISEKLIDFIPDFQLIDVRIAV
jgi:hypothetical protein